MKMQNVQSIVNDIFTNSLFALTMLAVSSFVWASHAGSIGFADEKSFWSFGVFLAVDGEVFETELKLLKLLLEVFNTPENNYKFIRFCI